MASQTRQPLDHVSRDPRGELPLGTPQVSSQITQGDRPCGGDQSAVRAGIGVPPYRRSGGSSRVPLVASLLHRTLHIAPTALDHPELVVAEGALHTPTSNNASQTDQPAPIDIAPDDGKANDNAADAGPVHWPHWPPPTRRDRAIVAGAAALVVVNIAGLWTYLPTERLARSDDSSQATATLTDHTEAVKSVAFSPNGRTLASGGQDQRVRIWKISA